MDVATLPFERAAGLTVVEGTSVKNEDDGLVLVEILLNVSSVTQARKAADAAVGAVSARWDRNLSTYVRCSRGAPCSVQ